MDGPKFPFGAKLSTKPPIDGPGPGKYNPNTQSFSQVKYSMGGKRPETVSFLAPGPGTYD